MVYNKKYYEKNKSKFKEINKKWSVKNKEKRQEYSKKYYEINKLKIKERNKENKETRNKYLERSKSNRKIVCRRYYKKNRQTILERGRKWKEINKERIREKGKEYREKTKQIRSEKAKNKLAEIKLKVISYYSNNILKCECCNITGIEFLTIDHINGGGNKHRKNEKISSMYRWLEKNNYPDGFQVLCYNCNCSKGFFGYCPHQKNLNTSPNI